jgi:FKBP-type peptidyl-prolyl cis-trans isomerase FkpA
MRSLIMVAFAGIILAGCGEDAKKEGTIELKTQKDKLSYSVGADHAKQLLQDPGFGNYDKDQIMEGFKVGIRDEKSFDVACQQTIQTMMGPGGQQFNPAYKSEGSLCIGKAMGSFFLNGWKQGNFISRFDLAMVETGFQSALDNADTLVDKTERDKMVTSLIGELNEKVFAEATKNEAVFFSKVSKIRGIKNIGNGLYLETIAEGKGGSPQVGDDVEANYALLSPKGDTLESSLQGVKMGQPLPAFSLNGVIQGWSIGFPQMKKGGKYRLYVPQGLAYGGNPPQGSPIDRFSPLVFYIELANYGKPGTLVKQQQMPQGM